MNGVVNRQCWGLLCPDVDRHCEPREQVIGFPFFVESLL